MRGRGGEGNALFGKYFHDSQFSMKLTDIMFSLDYIGANVGASSVVGGEAFVFDEITTTTDNELVTVNDAIAMSGAKPVIWIAKKGTGDKKTKIEESATAHKFEIPTAGTYCIMYRKTESAAEKLTIKSQFIPSTLHAVLTVALYSGDACNAETASKAGEIVIDIPRFQLSGAVELSMTATGASQTALDGTALASGCTSCDGTGVYATITKVITGAHWYDDAQGLVIEDLSGLTNPVTNKEVVVYAYYANKAPKKLAKNEWTLAKVAGAGTSSVDNDNKTISATAADATFVISATAVGKTTLDTNKAVIIA